jgi:hypothetical protein
MAVFVQSFLKEIMNSAAKEKHLLITENDEVEENIPNNR